MDELIVAALGPYKYAVMALSLTLVFLARKSIRQSHIVILLLITVAAFIAFFALFLWSLSGSGNKTDIPVLPALRFIAATFIGCGSAAGFYFILVLLGLAEPGQGRRTGPPR